MDGDSAGSLDDIAHLEKLAEVGFFFIDDVCFDRFFALKPSRGIEVATSATASQGCEAVRTFIGSAHFVEDSGRSPAVPAQ